METFTVRTSAQQQVVDITEMVEDVVRKSKVMEGTCLIFTPHATAGIILNEAEPNLEQDFLSFFGKVVPKGNWSHNKIDDNAEAHIKSALFGQGKVVPVSEGRLVRGTWQQIMLLEFDGPRERRICVVVK
jgi:secondary thiamine-phosphate synthase enzyme